MSDTAPIFNVQSLSTHDGPGLRTTVFFQGCPLRCTWCSNPEGQAADPQLVWHAERCRSCLECVTACPSGTVQASERAVGARPQFDRAACRTCTAWNCVTACAEGALRRVGQVMSRDEVLAVIEKDLRLFRNSGGGVTFTGGEPLLYSAFLTPILQRLCERCISTAIETCGHWEWSAAAECLRCCEVIFFDVKTLDDEVHRRLTGRSNELILSNLRRLAAAFAERVIVSVPVVPGVVESVASIEGVGALARELGLRRMRLLPYHQLGRGKYAALGMPYPDFHERSPAIQRPALEAMIAKITGLGLQAEVEGWA